MAKRVVGLDIGAYSIKVLHLENSEVQRSHEVPVSEDAIHALNDEGWLEGDIIVTGLPGVDAQVRGLDVPFSSHKKISSILGSLLDAQLPLEIDDLTLTWFLQTDKKAPQQRILAAFAKKSSIHAYLETLEKVGVNPNILTLKAAGLYDLLKQELKEPQTAAIIDMGAQSAGICIGNDKQLLLARSVLKADPVSILREVRQTLLSLENHRVEKIYLVGGGALAAGIEEQFAQVLEIPVSILRPFGLSPTMALAASYALIGQKPHEKFNRFNLRKDEFSFRSEIQLVTARTRTIGIWAGIVLVLLAINFGARRYFLGARIEDLVASEKVQCKQVMGKAIANCLPEMKKAIAKERQDEIPKMSATDIYLEVSKALPESVKVKLTDLDIGNGGVRLSGDTGDFESVDVIVNALGTNHCFKNVEKGRARQAQSGVNFQISMDVDCDGGKK
ncbi:MAG: hypothetical protein V4534_04125 [Myxococcota bacterium]